MLTVRLELVINSPLNQREMRSLVRKATAEGPLYDAMRSVLGWVPAPGALTTTVSNPPRNLSVQPPPATQP